MSLFRVKKFNLRCFDTWNGVKALRPKEVRVSFILFNLIALFFSTVSILVIDNLRFHTLFR